MRRLVTRSVTNVNGVCRQYGDIRHANRSTKKRGRIENLKASERAKTRTIPGSYRSTELVMPFRLTVSACEWEQLLSRRKSAGFNRSVIKAAGENWQDVRRFNSTLRRVERRPVTRVELKGPSAASKIAWKAAVLQQALIYRTVELAGSCAKMWNFGNVLCSVLAARALLETIAVTLDFETRLQDYYNASNFEEMDKLIMHILSRPAMKICSQKIQNWKPRMC